jgi:hypothetical protein
MKIILRNGARLFSLAWFNKCAGWYSYPVAKSRAYEYLVDILKSAELQARRIISVSKTRLQFDDYNGTIKRARITRNTVTEMHLNASLHP